MNRRIHPVLSAFFISLFAISSVAAIALAQRDQNEFVWGSVVHTSRLEEPHVTTMLGRAFFDGAYERASSFTIDLPVAGGVVPHHLLAAPLIAGFFKALESKPPGVVVLVGPDHFDHASAPIVTSATTWKTPYGILNTERKIIKRLVEDGILADDEAPWNSEHSIGAVIPFVHRSFPDSRIVPILVRRDATSEQIARLADELAKIPNSLVIASVDFSHYLPSSVAEFHDVLSENVLDTADVSVMKSLEIDSPGSLELLLRTMDRLGARRFVKFLETDSARLTNSPELEQTTSYVIGAYASGEPETEKIVTVLAVGDMMLERNVRVWAGDEWPEYPFARIRGLEDRFFRGVDLVVGNLEGPVSSHRPPEKEIDFAFDESIPKLLADVGFDAVNLANNHTLDQGRTGADETRAALGTAGVGSFGDQVKDDLAPWVATVRGKKIAFLGFNVTDNPLDESVASSTIRAASATNDIVIVNVHWGVEYRTHSTASQQQLGHKFIDWGADAVIGHHPHVIQEMEVYQGKPILYSLGNFIFDQEFSADVKRGLAVGLIFLKGDVAVYPFPISINRGQPQLVIGDAYREFIKSFKESSPGVEKILRVGYTRDEVKTP